MYNKVILIGTMADRPQEMYDTDVHRHVYISLKVSPPSDAVPTYWGGVYDLRDSDWPIGADTFPVICRDPLLVERCLKSFNKGDIVCVEGRLVLTVLRSDRDLVPLVEILASEVLLLSEHSSMQVQEQQL
jgi:Single-strand binding protein family